LIGAAVVLFLWNLMTGGSTPTPTPAPTAAVMAPAAAPPMPAAAVTSLSAKVYFEVGAATIGADGSKTLGAVADMIKMDGLKVMVTGYTDKTGDLATNEALAKSRSSAVRDALTAAGVAVVNIEMKPPTAASPHNTKAR
jgi:outer membrane protein OmpA-like peptidoglycan-associated protein